MARKLTKAQIKAIKERVWVWALTYYNDNSISDNINYDLVKDVAKVAEQMPKVTIPSFSVPFTDLVTMRKEVEESCLSDKAKEAILKALG